MRKKSYLIGNAHIDPVWLWDWQEGCAEVRNTFRSALDRLNETDEWIFTSSSACYYAWVEKIDPDMFEEIRRRVKEGRWSIVGGWWVQPDCNLPSGESFCRQSLYGQRYFYEKFGVSATVGYNVDSFGHNAALPQILAKSGMKNYVFSRPGAHEKDLPPLFTWQGLGGDTVRAARIPIGYESNSLPELKTKTEKFEKLRESGKVEQMLFYGVGNHGGGPTVEMLSWLVSVKDEKNFVFSSVPNYFNATESAPVSVMSGDLGKHAVGCYSADARIKSGNRRAENSLVAAEKFAVVASELFGFRYPADPIEREWKKVLFYQFHDSLGGCSIKSVCDSAVTAFDSATAAAAEISNAAMQKIASQIDTCGDVSPTEAKEKLGKPVVVFNPHSTESTFTVRVRRLAVEPANGFKSYEAWSEDGVCVPVQLVKCDSSFWYARDGIFRAVVPAFGYRLFYIRENTENVYENVVAEEIGESIPPLTVNVKYGGFRLGNASISAYFGREDDSSFSVARTDGSAAVSFDGWRFSVDEDKFVDTWGHAVDGSAWQRCNEMGVWAHCNNKLGDEIGRFCRKSFAITECGPVRSVLHGEWAYGRSEISCDFILYSDADYIEADVKLDFREKQKTARLVLPADCKAVECETAYGHIARRASGEEEFAHKWIDFGGRKSGFTLINDGTYSSRLNDNSVSVVLARSAVFADHGGVKERGVCYDHLDQGEIEHRFSIRPRAESDHSAATVSGNVFNGECYTVWEGYHKGALPQYDSFMKVSSPNVCVKVVKRAQDGNGVVIRAYETSGKKCRCDIELFGRKVGLTFKPFEIKTVLFGSDGKTAELDICEHYI